MFLIELGAVLKKLGQCPSAEELQLMCMFYSNPRVVINYYYYY